MARSLVSGLRARGADVQTVVEAGLRGKDDATQLQWAASNKRALYTFNVAHFCKLHGEYRENHMDHAGIIVVPRQRYSVKQQIRLLLNMLTQLRDSIASQQESKPVPLRFPEFAR